MPQKVSQNLNFQVSTNKLNDVETRLNHLIPKNVNYSGEIKFLNDTTNELEKLMSDITNGYDVIHIKFIHLINELKAGSKRSSENSLTNNSYESNKSPVKQNKKDKFQLLAQKFKTPLEHRTRTVFDAQEASKKPSQGQSDNQASIKSKKRSAILANLSNLGDENKEDSIIECDETKQKTVKKKTTKSKKAEGEATEKKKKKKKKVALENEDENKMEIEALNADNVVNEVKKFSQLSNNSEDGDDENKKVAKNPPKKIKLNKKKPKKGDEDNNKDEELVEIMDATFKDEGESKKNVKQSSKKQKSSDVSATGDASKVKKKKNKISKQASMLGVDENLGKSTPSNNTNIAKKISINSVLRLSNKKKSLLPQYVKNNVNLAKTPSNEHRLSSIKYLQSTIKKSIMRPVQTRARAAAQVTTKTITTNSTATMSGTQMKTSTSSSTVNLTKNQSNEASTSNKSVLSNVKSLASKFNAIATPNQQQRRISVLQQTASKLKTTLRNSIDKRKILSKGKETLKQSMTKEKAMAFLNNDNHKKSDERVPSPKKVSKNNPVVLINETVSEIERRSSSSGRRSIRITSDTLANVHNNAEEDIINEMKNKTPKVSILKMPNSMFANGNTILYSASKFNKLNENQRTITQTISMSSIKNTPSRTFNQTSLVNLQASSHKSAIKPSFVKFLERNTPSKLTHTELEEKRRAELLSKDNKEKERLQEMERQKNEKREEIKRRNEEKLKKAAEQKMQKEAEFKQKIESKNNSVLSNTAHNIPSIKKNFLGASNQFSANPQTLTNKLLPNYGSSNESIVNFKQPVQISKSQHAIEDEITNFKKNYDDYKRITNQQMTVNLANDLALKGHNLNELNNYNKFSSHFTKTNSNLETTYILNSPSSSASSKANMHQSLLKASFSNYEVTPLQPLKLKNDDNYDVSELQSGDETDDEEEPSKPLPTWAKEPFITDKAKAQSSKMINFTRLFRGASNYDINLEGIFKIKRKKFTERSSSAIWETPPVWATSGLNGEESFYKVRKGF